MRRVPIVLVLMLAACSAESPSVTDAPPAVTASPTLAPTPSPTPVNFGRFDIDNAMEHVRALAVEIGSRQAGTEGDRLGATYIEEQLIELGWEVSQQEFPLPQGGTSTNVIGMSPDFSTAEPYVIVGGHMDSLNGPGANDNATGIAAALEIARAVTEVPAPLPVKFVAFGAEERQPAPGRPHHVGSVYYVEQMTQEERDNLAVFVNLDMIGHGSTLWCGRLAVGPRHGTEACLNAARRGDLEVRERVTPDWSDHGSFAKEDMNTAWLWTGNLPCCYHNPRDTIDVVIPADLKRAGQLGLAVVRVYEGLAS